MRTETINFPDQQTLSVFPVERSNLEQAILALGLNRGYPVIVLIGDEINEPHGDVTRRAIEMIARTAEGMNAVVICGGRDIGVMAEIGKVKSQNGYKFPLVGVTPEEQVTWPHGPLNTKFLWLGKQRWQLASHYSHFILVPGEQFGDEAPWIVDTATVLSKGQRSVTILISGGEISRKDIELSVENGRPVLVLSRTGGLADEFARQPERNSLITVFPAQAEKTIAEAVQAALSNHERSGEVAFQAIDERTG